MTEPMKTYTLPSMPGVRRDGTVTDSDYFNDAQWVRFLREKGRVRKMGGYQLSSNTLAGPARGTFVWSHQYTNRVFTFSQFGVQYVDIDANGLGGAVNDITPAGYAAAATTLWSYDILFDAAAGSGNTVLLCTPMNTLTNMDDPTQSAVYTTIINATPVAQLVAITDVNAVAPGGLFCTPPYAFLLGNDGNCSWSDANLPQNYGGAGSNPGGDQGTARVTGTKLVKGLPMRSGSGPGGMIWSLDSVVRADFVGGSDIFKFSQINSGESSVLSQNAIIQYNSDWFWIGIDKFYVSDGATVAELPNMMSRDWFFDNLNFSQRQKVWALRMPRWGEIWWFFPFGDATECDHAIIYSTTLQTWYDTAITRSSGTTPRVIKYPLMTDTAPNNQMVLTYTVSAGSVAVNDVLRGVVSGATGSVQLIQGGGPFTAQVTLTNAPVMFEGEAFVDVTSAATGTITAAQALYSLYTHEHGNNAVNGVNSDAIPAYFETCNFGLPTGGTQITSMEGVDQWTRLRRVEPDFELQGAMTMDVITREFAQSEDVVAGSYTFDSETGKIDTDGVQGREIRIRFTSNAIDGFFEQGDIIITTDPGDVRA